MINANINGGVRTAFKSSRLKFAGSNVTIGRSGNARSLPLQMPETSLMTANTVIDFSQGAITTSTETTHVALQGTGFFKLRRIQDDPLDPNTQFYYSRDGEFHWMQLPVGAAYGTPGGGTSSNSAARSVLVNSAGLAVTENDSDLISFKNDFSDPVLNPGSYTSWTRYRDSNFALFADVKKFRDPQALLFSRYGSTVFSAPPQAGTETAVTTAETTRLTKSLEASNASMTQSVPELSLAQKLFSALTKVLQISQTNTDALLNLIR
ncbi:MAG: hypothetical protein H7338_18185 [Candidatus Sericytochromatia bacterium]|nr:hypothetical protein [Candidatus Sericytochromatia bacterium]